jgi:hypothetical protein
MITENAEIVAEVLQKNLRGRMRAQESSYLVSIHNEKKGIEYDYEVCGPSYGDG